MFEYLRSQHTFRGCWEVLVQPLTWHKEGKLCGSCGRKTYPETVYRCASYTLVHSGGAGLKILWSYPWSSFGQSKIQTPLDILPAECLRLSVIAALPCDRDLSLSTHLCLFHTSAQVPEKESASSWPQERL